MDQKYTERKARWDVLHGIGFRFAWVAALSVVLSFLLLGAIAYKPVQGLLMGRETAALDGKLALATQELCGALERLRDDLEHPATVDLATGLLRAEMVGDEREHWERQSELAYLFSRLLEQRPLYQQIRLLGSAPEGQELVRVERAGGSLRVVPGKNLRRRGERDYFREAAALERGQLYVTAFSYHYEDGQPQRPLRPVLRVLRPVFLAGSERPAAFLMIDLSAAALLERLRASLDHDQEVFLHDPSRRQTLAIQADQQRSDYLDAKSNQNFQRIFGDIRKAAEGDSGFSSLQDGALLYGAQPMAISWGQPERLFWVVSRTSAASVAGDSRRALHRLVGGGLLFLLVAAVLAGLWGASMARPLNRVTQTIDRFARGEHGGRLPESEVGEIGSLVSSVRLMRQQVEERTERLRQEIARSKELEDEKILFHQRLNQSQKLEAIGSMAGGLAHDFNNLLTAVFGFADLLARSKNLGPSEREWLDHLLDAARRGRDLIRRVLTFSRQEEISRHSLHLASVLDEAIKLLRASIPASIKIAVNSRTDAFIVGDETQLSQVILNLGTNASHAVSRQNGEIEFLLDEQEVDAHFCESHPGLEPGPHVLLTVRDNGKGMSRDTQLRIFEPFFTTKPVGEGTGLGLAVVHGIVRAHGGTITVYSEEERGSTFRIYLPAEAAAEESGPREASPEDRKLPEFMGRVMVVDDEEPIRTVVSKMLSSVGYEVEARSSGIEGLSAYLQEPDAYSLIITDQTMPEMNGDQLIVAVRQRSRSIPIILTTGYSSVLTPRRLEELAVGDVLLKPYSERDLLGALRRL